MKIKQVLALLILTTCNILVFGEDKSATDVFANGADVSWVTQMEANGKIFYNAAGTPTECMTLLKSLGMNSIRLRVWVNPSDGWCNAQDMLAKAIRANNLGMRIMIDFHYSDSWADPSKQTKPATWANLSFIDLKTAIATHTTNILNLLKTNNITPEWVQVGNETGNGMLWPDGMASTNMANYAALNNAGYDAVKVVFPNAKVIVHVQNGFDNGLFRWLFDGLKNNGGKWDVVGMSLYPSNTNWSSLNAQCLTNMNDMIFRYGKEVMICEVGMSWDSPSTFNFLTDLINKTKSIPNGKGLGVFYWEPECYSNWNGYTLGAFDNNGKPTVALNAFNNLTVIDIPTKSKLNIYEDSQNRTIIFNDELSKIEIININGSTMKSVSNSNSISYSMIPKGFYLLRVKTRNSNKEFLFKFICN